MTEQTEEKRAREDLIALFTPEVLRHELARAVRDGVDRLNERQRDG